MSELFFSIDIEADGPIPGPYSMVSIGASVCWHPDKTFYREMRPISDKWVPEALAVSGLKRDDLIAHAMDPKQAMTEMTAWVRQVCDEVKNPVSGKPARPVFVAFNATFDWLFTYWYFVNFTGACPFGISGLDIKAYYMGALRKQAWAQTTKRAFNPAFLSAKRHTHNALDDATEQAEIFEKLYEYTTPKQIVGRKVEDGTKEKDELGPREVDPVRRG